MNVEAFGIVEWCVSHIARVVPLCSPSDEDGFR